MEILVISTNRSHKTSIFWWCGELYRRCVLPTIEFRVFLWGLSGSWYQAVSLAHNLGMRLGWDHMHVYVFHSITLQYFFHKKKNKKKHKCPVLQVPPLKHPSLDMWRFLCRYNCFPLHDWPANHQGHSVGAQFSTTFLCNVTMPRRVKTAASDKCECEGRSLVWGQIWCHALLYLQFYLSTPNSNAARFTPFLPLFTASIAACIESSDQECSVFGWLTVGRVAACLRASAERRFLLLAVFAMCFKLIHVSKFLQTFAYS